MCLVPAEMLQSGMALCLEARHPHQELAQDILQELLHLLGRQVRMQSNLALELLHMSLKLLLQRSQSLLGLLQSLGAGSGRALHGQQGDLDVPQELYGSLHLRGVVPQRCPGLDDVLLKYNKYGLICREYSQKSNSSLSASLNSINLTWKELALV